MPTELYIGPAHYPVPAISTATDGIDDVAYDHAALLIRDLDVRAENPAAAFLDVGEIGLLHYSEQA